MSHQLRLVNKGGSDGMVTVAANTPSGTYSITYQICEVNSSDVNVTHQL
jgi:hypothetical protein